MSVDVAPPPPAPVAPAAPMAAIADEIDYEGLGENYPLYINMLAGSLAGITEHGVMFPVDLVRVCARVTLAYADTHASDYRFASSVLYKHDRRTGKNKLCGGYSVSYTHL